MNFTGAFGSFSVSDLEAARKFYGKTLGLDVREEGDMGLQIPLPGGGSAFLYSKDDHLPATFTVLNLVVPDIDAAVDNLTERGIGLERYDDMPQDERGILRGLSQDMGPDIAWFKDPSGNILSVVQEK